MNILKMEVDPSFLEIRNSIERIFEQFKFEELGNRLSQFSYLKLRELVMVEVDKLTKKD